MKFKLSKIVHNYDISRDVVRVLETWTQAKDNNEAANMTITPGVAGAEQVVTIKLELPTTDEAKAYLDRIKLRNLSCNEGDRVVIQTAAQAVGL